MINLGILWGDKNSKLWCCEQHCLETAYPGETRKNKIGMLRALSDYQSGRVWRDVGNSFWVQLFWGNFWRELDIYYWCPHIFINTFKTQINSSAIYTISIFLCQKLSWLYCLNIFKFFGGCWGGGEWATTHTFMSNCDGASWIHSGNGKRTCTSTWPGRNAHYNLSIDISQHKLHNQFIQQKGWKEYFLHSFPFSAFANQFWVPLSVVLS